MVKCWLELQNQVIGNKGATNLDYLIRLKEILATRFNLDELRTLCFHLGVDFENFPIEGKSGKVEELVQFMERRHRIPELVEKGKQLRADISWD